MGEISERITRHVPLLAGCLRALAAWVTRSGRVRQRWDLVCVLSLVRNDSTATRGLSNLAIADRQSSPGGLSHGDKTRCGLPIPLAQAQMVTRSPRRTNTWCRNA
jgi:hypothetical protein